MEKDKMGKAVRNTIRTGLSYGIGLGTGLVTTTICMAYMPSAAPKAIEMAFKAGTYGLSGVTGSVAATLVQEEWDECEVRAKRFLNKHKKDKVKVEIVK